MNTDDETAPTHLAVRVAEHWFGVSVDRAAVAQRPIGVAPLPGGPPWLLGITWSQDSPVGLVDLAQLAGVGSSKATLLLRIAGTPIALATTGVSSACIRLDTAVRGEPLAPWTLAPRAFENGVLHPIDCDALLGRVSAGR